MDDFDMPEEGQAVLPADGGEAQVREPDEAERRLVARTIGRIKADRKHHAKAFERMRTDMQIARVGGSEAWAKHNYTANITGRHIKQLVSTLYAKNPKAIARRRERLDFAVWDENEETLMQAAALVQAAATIPPQIDPLTGQAIPAPMPPDVQQAMAVMEDFQTGMAERKMIERVGKTLEILFNYYCGEQKPVDFKTAMKQAVRRTATCAVSYVEIGFQREHKQDAVVAQQIADVRAQVEHIRVLQEKLTDPDEIGDQEIRQRELELSLRSLQAQEYVLIREGLVFDFPEATRVIPHKRCRALTGFVGADWLTIEYLYTPDEVRRIFRVDVGRQFTPYTPDGKCLDDSEPEFPFEDEPAGERDGLVCVWKHYDRVAGLTYCVADGHCAFLRQPAPPDVYVEGFWPVHALVFNECEDPDELFPPSDVQLMRDMQEEWNRSRQGKREHRRAARPRFLSRRGSLTDDEKTRLGTAEPFSVIEVNPQEALDLSAIIVPVEMPGVDPNLYDVNEIGVDIQMTVGSSRSSLQAPASSTATGEAIAEEASAEASGSNVDDLDSFLTAVARDAGQIMLREVSAETARKIAGRGAVWPQVDLETLAGEVFLEIEAGSSGKPNAAQEIRNWREMLPFLIQMPNINPTWLARESLRRLDDRMDLTDAIADGFPAIVAMNRGGGVMGEDPGAAPDQQGQEGAQNGAPAPAPPAGGERGMGNNRI